MLMLKAAVFGTEQKLSSKNKSTRLRGSYEVRETVSSDLFKRKNKGIETRQEMDDIAFNKRRRTEDRVSAALRVKAEMYDQLVSDGATADNTLIDFTAKRNNITAKAASEASVPTRSSQESVSQTPRSYYEPPDAPHHQPPTQQQQQWAWSTGREHTNDADTTPTPALLLSSAEMEQRIEEAARSRSGGARVKSQWEKILSKESHAILDQIHATTEQQRINKLSSSAGDIGVNEVKLSAKEERRRLLQQKRQEQKLKN